MTRIAQMADPVGEMSLTPHAVCFRLEHVEVRRIGIVLFDGYQGLDLVGPFEVFRGAADALSLAGVPSTYELVLIGSPTAASETGLSIGPVVAPDDAGPLDTLVIPGGRGVRAAAGDPEVVRWVRELATPVRRLSSVCTGAFLLAATGLIDGATVATHWAFAEDLALAYPNVRVDGSSIYRHDGRLWTSAGVTAGIDLALAMVEDDHDAEVAHLLASWLVVFLRRPGSQRQFARPTTASTPPHPGVGEALEFIDQHLEHALPIDAIAAAVGMSPRNFGRVFRQVVGLPPGAYVQQRRLDVARELLERTDEPLCSIARRSGLGSAETLRRVMRDQVGVSPDAYRRRFSHHHDNSPR